jgi:integrase
MKKLTEAIVAGLPVTGRDLFVFDAVQRGLALRITPAGARIFIAQAGVDGRKRRITIGYHPELTVAEARRKAATMLADLRAGEDPKAAAFAREAARAGGSITVRELAEKWLTEYVRLKLKPSSAYGYERLLKANIIPAIGNVAVAQLDKAAVMRLHAKMAGTKRQANFALAVLRSLMRYAEDLKLRPPHQNPTDRIKRYRERKSERFLSEAEIAKVMETITTAESSGKIGPFAAAGIKLAMLTGARSGELSAARWTDIDWQRRIIILKDHKTDAGDSPRIVHLSDAAIDVLRGLHRVGPYILAGRKPGTALKLSHVWMRVRGAAGLEDVRLHDLRHSYASLALARGTSLSMVGRLLGHRDLKSTARYAHLAHDDVAAAADNIGSAYEAAIAKGAQPAGKVLKMPRRPRATQN